MGYINNTEYMQFAWVTSLDAQTSTQVSLLIDSTKDILDWLIWDLSYWNKQEDIKICEVDYKFGYSVIQLSNLEVASITEINWKAYTGVLDTDYRIQDHKNSKLYIKNLVEYTSWLDFPYFTIKYVSGYQTIPNDIKYMQYLMVSWELAKTQWQEIKSYSLWPRSITFKDIKDFDTVKSTIFNYSTITV